MTLAATATVIALGAIAAGAEPPALATCRRLDQAFDTTAMPAPCARALDDVALPVADRIDAARLLAFALVTNGDLEGGERAFVRLLVLAPDWTLPASASPRMRDAFGRARTRLATDGKVTVSASTTAGGEAGAGWTVTARVVDGLGRVADVRWIVSPAGGPPSAGTMTPASEAGVWTAPVPSVSGATCVVEALGIDASVLATSACEGFVPSRTGAGTVAAAAAAGEEPPWVLVGAGIGAGGVVVVAVGALVWAFTSGPFAPPAAVTVSIQ
jgi:hypothetical protein